MKIKQLMTHAKLDLSWKTMYLVGGISAILYVLLALVVPFFMFITETELIGMVSGVEVIQYIAEHGVGWWMVLQALVLCASFFAIIAFVALFLSLKHLDKSLALIGTILASVIHILFIAYWPVLCGMAYLAQHYQEVDAVQQASLASAIEALLAINNAYNPVYEMVFAVSILLLSVVMLKGVYQKWIGYVGIGTGILGLIMVPMFPIIGVNYFWWWMPFNVWFVALGVRLIKLGGKNNS